MVSVVCVCLLSPLLIISGEIGKLVDGIISGDDDDFWLGWNKSPVSIEFHFDVSRQFKTIRLYTMNDKYHSVQVQFDGTLAIKHQPSPLMSSTPTLFIDAIDLSKYDTTFIAKRVQITFEFTNELFLLTEIQFDNEANISLNQTSTMNITTNCPLGKSHRSCFPSQTTNDRVHVSPSGLQLHRTIQHWNRLSCLSSRFNG
jgi:hypothetical protein